MHRLFIATTAAFLLAAGAAAATEPTLTEGTILTRAINVQVAPAEPALHVTVDQGTVGANAILASLTSPSGRTVGTGFIQVPAYPPSRKVEVPFLLQSPFTNGAFTLYSEPGRWKLTSVTLLTNDNQFVSYYGSQLAALFHNKVTVTVTNTGTPDTTPPVFTTGRIMTPTVSLSSASPVFAVNLAVSDDVSGVSGVYLQYQPPSGNQGGANSVISLPIMAGTVVSYATLPATSPIGTYTLTALDVCDFAGNCAYDTSAADLQKIFGATTFQVTN